MERHQNVSVSVPVTVQCAQGNITVTLACAQALYWYITKPNPSTFCKRFNKC